MGCTFTKASKMLWAKKEVRIIMQGLDAAGKTSILYRLKLGEVVTTMPSLGLYIEHVKHKDVSFAFWDIGGRGKMRAIYRHFYRNTDAIIFVIDSNDHERIDEIREEYQMALREDDLRDACILFVANKQDLPNAMSVDQVTELLQCHTIKQQWYITGTSVLTGEGLHEGLDWIADTLAGKYTSTAVVEPITTAVDNTAKQTGLKEAAGFWNGLVNKIKSHWFGQSLEG